MIIDSVISQFTQFLNIVRKVWKIIKTKQVQLLEHFKSSG